MLWGDYEPETEALFMRIVRPGMTVVDIGAHIGYFTRLFSKLVGKSGRVIAIEADPENFLLLEKNTRGRGNVARMSVALSDHSGTTDFWRGEKSGTHSLVQAPFRPTRVSVHCELFDELAKRENIGRVDTMKIDIEGGEQAAFLGMREFFATHPPTFLVVELNPECIALAGDTEEAFLARLAGLGYRLFAIHDKGFAAIDANTYTKETLAGASFINLLGVHSSASGGDFIQKSR
jgi:FkbM family methyltransferase